ncbi:hypothetical protein BRD20_09315 [Halobacteriales archaeon SW_8_65_20]|nr:MAG: hypothetical protein BRD20_09315 [Halobacteriales archaeon SW_8_65_20]
MTRKTPSRTKRELDKLRRRRNGDGDDGPPEVVVELAGVAPRDPEDDEDERRPADDRAAFESFTVDLASGAVETQETPDADALAECSTAGCPNPVMPPDAGISESDLCEKCAGMPSRDWRPVVSENEEENRTGDGDE